MKITNFQDLKDFCNSLTDEQLKQEPHFCMVDSHVEKIQSAYVSEQDEYFDHGDSLGTLEMLQHEYPDEWESMAEDSTIVPKGTVFILNE